MSEQSSNILEPSSKDAQIAYLLELASSLEAQIDCLAKDNDALAKEQATLTKDLVAVRRERDYFKIEYDKVVEQIKIVNARYFGVKTEKIQPYQLSLFNEVEAVTLLDKPEPSYKEALPKKRKNKRSIDYSKFDTEIIEYTLSEEDRACTECNTIMEEMGVELKHTLKLIPARLICEEHRRHVYVCRPCSKKNAIDAETPTQIIKAPLPHFPLEKSCATPSLLAHLLHQKYTLSQPLYRIAEDMKNQMGLTLSRGTLASWVIRTHERWLALLYSLMKKRLLSFDIIHCDETKVQVLKEPERKPTSTSYMWLFASAACEVPLFIFDYHPTRARSVVRDFLDGWSGTIITDGYAAYEDLGSTITRVSCLVHIRRKYADIIKGIDKDTLEATGGIVSTAALKKIDEIVRIDNGFDDMDAGTRKQARLEILKPKMDAFYAWCREKRDEAMPSMALYKALNYSISQWPGLENALADGRLPLDNNRAERAIRPFAIGRRNWLFSDTQKGAHASAAIYSLITTAKGNGLNPREYLCWLLEEMPGTEKLADEAVLMKFLPWSNAVPDYCRIDAAEAAAEGTDLLDEPFIDIDPNMLREEDQEQTVA
jgi:transposase